MLEIGTGSGYQAAVLVASGGRGLHDRDRRRRSAEQARRTLDELGYRNVHVRIGDGYQGWPEEAPFDAIVVTAAPPRIPQPLLDQLKVGGRDGAAGRRRPGRISLVLTKRADGSFERRQVLPVRFVPMTGEAQRGGPAPAH